MYNIVQAVGAVREKDVCTKMLQFDGIAMNDDNAVEVDEAAGVRMRTSQQQQHGLGGNSLLWHLFVLVL